MHVYIQGRFATVVCRVSNGRVQKACLCAGDLKDAFKVQGPELTAGSHAVVNQEAKGPCCKTKESALEARR